MATWKLFKENGTPLEGYDYSFSGVPPTIDAEDGNQWSCKEYVYPLVADSLPPTFTLSGLTHGVSQAVALKERNKNSCYFVIHVVGTVPHEMVKAIELLKQLLGGVSVIVVPDAEWQGF